MVIIGDKMVDWDYVGGHDGYGFPNEEYDEASEGPDLPIFPERRKRKKKKDKKPSDFDFNRTY
jgi:hypothetical protein